MLSQDETHSIVISGNEGSNDSELDHTYAREQHDDCESSGEVVIDADSEPVSLQSFKWLIHRPICLSRKCSTPQRMNSKKVYYFEQNEFIREVVWEVSNASIGLAPPPWNLNTMRPLKLTTSQQTNCQKCITSHRTKSFGRFLMTSISPLGYTCQ